MADDAPEKMIRLISADGHEFIVPEELAFISPTIVTLMNGPALANGECHLTRIPSNLLSIVVRYLHYKKHYPPIAWPDCFPPAALNIPPHLHVDATHAADFLGLVRHVRQSGYVRLISSDGHEFIVKKDFALQSQTIRAVLNEAESSEIPPGGSSLLRLSWDDGRVFDVAGMMDLPDETIREVFRARILRLAVLYLFEQHLEELYYITRHELSAGDALSLITARDFLGL